MHIRRLFAIGALILIGGLLAACGSEDEDAEPTAAPATRITSDQEAEIEPTDAATAESVDASPAASPAATPVSPVATAVADIVPVTDESVDATPETDAVVPIGTAEEAASPVSAEPEATEVPKVELSGTLTLDGRAQQDFTLSDEGCVGLGEWRQLEPGTQVIVRNASGTVVDIAQLEGQDAGDACAWSFAVDVPADDFFSISIPMVTEVWFDQNDPAVQSGELELFVP